MAHFAKIDSSVVADVIVIDNGRCNNLEFPDSEPIGQAYIASMGIEGEWLQTSYSGSFRGIYAGIGDIYDAELDEFVAPIIPE